MVGMPVYNSKCAVQDRRILRESQDSSRSAPVVHVPHATNLRDLVFQSAPESHDRDLCHQNILDY